MPDILIERSDPHNYLHFMAQLDIEFGTFGRQTRVEAREAKAMWIQGAVVRTSSSTTTHRESRPIQIEERGTAAAFDPAEAVGAVADGVIGAARWGKAFETAVSITAAGGRTIGGLQGLWRGGRPPLHEPMASRIGLEEFNTAMGNLAEGQAIRQLIEFPA